MDSKKDGNRKNEIRKKDLTLKANRSGAERRSYLCAKGAIGICFLG